LFLFQCALFLAILGVVITRVIEDSGEETVRFLLGSVVTSAIAASECAGAVWCSCAFAVVAPVALIIEITGVGLGDVCCVRCERCDRDFRRRSAYLFGLRT